MKTFNSFDLAQYNFELPSELIAQYPLTNRAQAKMMVVDRERQMVSHDIFANIDQYLPPESMIVLNDSKVVPARLLAKRASGGEVEIFLLKKLADGFSYEVLMRPLKRLKEGEVIHFNDELNVEIIDKEKRIVRFNRQDINKFLYKIGHIPLPPYIRRADEGMDHEYYQTVYAQHEGSVASPTAGLHFTQELLKELQQSKHEFENVTLHINYATFKSVEVEDIRKHPMHTEEFRIAESTYQNIINARKHGRKVIAVGTTSCRVLESAANLKKLTGETNLFIYPGYTFRMVDILVTNFHQPLSTLLMLVHAFGGRELMKHAYQEAIDQKYRFFSYGDGMIII